MGTDRFTRLTAPGVVERILVRGTNWLGDAVLTTPALQALRRGFPRARITLLAKPTVAELLQGHPAVDKIVVYKSPGPHAGLTGKLALARQLRTERYQLAVLFQNAFEAAAIVTLAGIRHRYGYATDGRWLLLTHPVRLTRRIRRSHQTAYYLEMLRPLDIAVSAEAPALWTTAEEDAAATEAFHRLGVGPGQPVIGVNPGSTYGTAKRWLPERFAQVAGRLATEYGAHVLIFGGPGEQAVGRAIADKLSTSAVSMLSGRTTIRQLMAFIKQCRLFVTNDCGPMHIAAAFGVPLVAIFGPTDPATTSPSGNRHTVVRRPVECSPCLLRECPIDHRCMQGIGADVVYEAAVRQLGCAGLEPITGRREPAADEADTLVQAGLGAWSPSRSSRPEHGMSRPVVFLDRDGTLNLDPGYLNHPDRMSLLPGVGPAVVRLNRAGYKTVVVTNQSGVGRGLIEKEALEAIHARLRELLAEHGAHLDGIYACLHRPDEGCDCRKPGVGLVLQARRELGLAMEGQSIVIGDKATDVELARNVGALAIFVLSGERPEEERTRMAAAGLSPDYVARDLGEAVAWILKGSLARVHNA